MKMKQRILPALLTSVFLGVAAPAVQAQTFPTSVVVFGDSLSDAGYFRPVLQASGVPASLLPILGRFTTAPGPVWAELVAQHYGVAAVPSNVAGGTDFAQGGARVATNSSSTPPGAAQRSVQTQIGEYLARTNGVADSNALYAIWAGANDVIQTLGGISAGTIPSANGATIIQSTAAAEIAQIARLQAAGARYIVVLTLPDIGATPGLRAAGATASAGASQLSAGYNLALLTGLAQAGVRVIAVDSQAIFADILANAAAFGFTNTTTPACGAFPPFSTSPDSLFCPPNVWLTPTANQTFLFADGIHPTSAVHALVAQFVESMIDGPIAYSSLAEVPLRTRTSHVRTISDALANTSKGEAGRVTVFASADRAPFTIDSVAAVPGLDSTNKSITAGIAMRATEAVTVGAAIGNSRNDGSFGRNLGSYNTRETVMSIFATMGWGGFYGTGVVSISDLNFRNIQRNIALGTVTRHAQAQAKGSNASAFFSAGYDFRMSRLRIGPTVSVMSQNVDIDQFDETGADSANLRIYSQKRRSEVWSAGVRASVDVAGWTPWVRVTADRERRDDERLVTAAPMSLALTTGNSYDLPAYRPDKSFATGAIGIYGVVAQRFGLSLAYYKVSGRSGIKEDGVSGMLSYQF
jgi:outer membrane lipase/esterase